jgi:alpha-tubulin suppressor-like RCC1 family protein
LTDVVGIAAGSSHSLALKKDGTVIAWGSNGDKECDVPSGLTDVVGIAAGSLLTASPSRKTAQWSLGVVTTSNNAMFHLV